MQYYKLLAKEVEKRIKCLKPYVDMETVEEVPGALELTSESEEKTDETEGSCLLERYCHPSSPLNDNMYKAISSNVTVKTTDPSDKSMNMLFGFNVSINNSRCGNSSPKRCKASIEVPERDYNCPKKPESLLNEFENVQNLKTHKKGLGELTELNQAIKNEESERKPMLKKEDREMGQALRKTEIGQARKKESAIIKASTKRQPEMNQPLEEPDMKQSLETEITTISLSKDKSDLSKLLKTCYDNIEEEFIPFKIEASLRSFTGSLHDINADSSKSPTPLVRQRSYTVLKPSPLLIQHLQLQAKNTGVDLKLISMSESLSNIPQLQKKKRRRSWDLETAKSQWSTMALDLKRNAKPVLNLNGNAKTSAKQHNPSPYLTNSADRCRKPIPRNTKSPKSDPIQRSKLALSKNNVSEKSYLKISQPAVAANKIDKNGGPPAQTKESPPKVSPHSPIPAADDPATKVRELYEKIQKQQIDQMTNLVEKQKQEQMLLQQVFEEQNNMLFKQLKSICPEPTVEIKQAWCEKNHNAQRGPVSLSQLINHSPIESAPQSTVAKTLIPQSPGSPNNLSHRGDKSKRSSQMSNIKYNNHSVRPRARVVTGNNASRKLNYDNSGVSSDYEPMLTDRTNDTMADLNVTFPTDNSDESPPCKNSPRRTNTDSPSNIHQRKINSNSKYTDNAIRCLENSIQKTMHTVTALTKQHTLMNPIPQEVKQLMLYIYFSFFITVVKLKRHLVSLNNRYDTLSYYFSLFIRTIS